jgi:hypothetical protein
LLPFSPEPSIFSVAVENLKNKNIQDNNFACGSVSVRNLVSGRLRVFENRMLRRISGPKRDEVTAEWRKLLHDLYFPPSITKMINSRRMKWVGHVARVGGNRNMYRLLRGKPEGKRPLGRPRQRWVDNIRMDLG